MNTPFNWTCPYCGQPTSITSHNYDTGFTDLHVSDGEYSNYSLYSSAICCPNPECGNVSLEVSWFEQGWNSNAFSSKQWGPKNELNHWQLLPRSKAKPLPDYIPAEIKANYEEACLIQSDSPKASAAMSRRCLQGIIRDFWEIPVNKRGNLGAEISFIKDRISADTLDTINAVREVGDIGAHMEKAVDTIVDVEPDEAELLVSLIETLIDDWYVARHKRAARNLAVQEIVKQKRESKKESKQKLAQKEASANEHPD